MDTQWQDNQMCFACGIKNPVGLHLTFQPLGDNGLQSEYTPGQIYQGFADVVHGGFLGLLLDEVMVNLYFLRKKQIVVTAELLLRLHQPARVGNPLIIQAFPEGKPKGRLVLARGEIRLRDTDALIASATAKCMSVK